MGIKFSNFVNGLQDTMSKNAPHILIGIGVSGMLTSIGLTIPATVKATRLVDAKKEELGVDKLSKKEVLKTVWKCYIPTLITTTTSTVCVFGGSAKHARRHAALATAYKVSETAFSEYREKVRESLGERKDDAIRDLVAKKHVEDNPVKSAEIIVTEKGNTLCYDHLSGRYFKSDIDHIQKAVNNLNRAMMFDMGGYVSLNDFYDELSLSHTKVGDDLGWNLDHGLIDIHFGSQIADNGTPCIVLDYTVAPIYDYDKRI